MIPLIYQWNQIYDGKIMQLNYKLVKIFTFTLSGIVSTRGGISSREMVINKVDSDTKDELKSNNKRSFNFVLKGVNV